MNKEKNRWGFLVTALMMVLALVGSAFAQDDVQPTIVSVSPQNNAREVAADEPIRVTFSEAMDSSTINTRTIKVMQRTTPADGDYRSQDIEAIVTYDGRVATIDPAQDFSASQEFGNVFTVTVTTGAMDLAGNPIARNYVWSFTTGEAAFYTDSSTSALDQTPTYTPTTTSPAPAPTPAPTAAANDMTWLWWVLGAAALALLAAFLLLRSRSEEHRKVVVHSVHHKPVSRTPFGDVLPVVQIEGIGPVYEKELNAMGIMNTKQLWEADAEKVAAKTGAPLTLVESWQHMAELASINDIGPQYAELLERSGVHSIEELKHCSTAKLLRMVREKQDSLKTNIQGNAPGPSLVEHWIDEAKHHKKFRPA